MKGQTNAKRVATTAKAKVGPKPQANNNKARTGTGRGAKGVQQTTGRKPVGNPSDSGAQGRAASEAVSSEKVIPVEYIQTIETKSVTRLIFGSWLVFLILGILIGKQL